MSKILELLAVVSGLIPVVLTLIEQFETPGFGAEKKKVVLKTIGIIYDSLNLTTITKEKVLGIAGSIIDVAIGFYNAVGWFKKSNPTPSS